MGRYIVRRLLIMLLTMLGVSMLVFAVVEIAPGNIARNILGNYVTAEQEESMTRQLGLARPAVARYVSWLAGSDWQARRLIGREVREIVVAQGTQSRYRQWWAVMPDGSLAQWQVRDDHLYRLVRTGNVSTNEVLDDGAWRTAADGSTYFWGIDIANRAVKWVRGEGGTELKRDVSGWKEVHGAPVDYLPLSKGLLRGDGGISLMYNQPVSGILATRIRNSAIFAGLALLISMPLALILGLLAGLARGRWPDRVISLLGLVTTSSPDFAVGLFSIMFFALWLKWLPATTLYANENAVWTNPKMLVLPLFTVAMSEVGYILRITRTSVIDVSNSPYVRTAYLKGLSYPRIVFRHVLRNALMAPVTVITLHITWLIGGLVVVETVFGFPGLGALLVPAAMFKDVYIIEAGTMVIIALAVGTQLLADILYALLNPRIRYA
jgi:peptide/nickel transport system permease protein